MNSEVSALDGFPYMRLLVLNADKGISLAEREQGGREALFCIHWIKWNTQTSRTCATVCSISYVTYLSGDGPFTSIFKHCEFLYT